MATLYITEFSKPAMTVNGLIPAASLPTVVAEQTVAISGSSTASAAFSATTSFVRVHTDAICSIEYGSNPTATTAKARMPADSVEYFGVNAGDKIAVISNT